MANKNYLRPQSRQRRNKEVQQDEMKPHYDFSVAERGKFYRADVEFQFPVFLEPDIHDFLTQLAEQKSVAVDELVNDLLRADINIIQSAGN